MKKNSPPSPKGHNVGYDGFRGPDPQWLPADVKQHLEYLRRRVGLDVAAGEYLSLDDAKRLYHRHFNNEHMPFEEIYSMGHMPALIELAVMSRQIASKGVRRSALFRDPSIHIELARDSSLKQAKIAKNPRPNSLASRIRTLNIRSYAEATKICPEIVNELVGKFGPEMAKKKLSQAIAKQRDKNKLP